MHLQFLTASYTPYIEMPGNVKARQLMSAPNVDIFLYDKLASKLFFNEHWQAKVILLPTWSRLTKCF
jgi:hypothetical protein